MAVPPPDTVLRQIGDLQAHLPPAASLAVGVAALGAVTVPAIWSLVRHVGVIAHEGAHAVLGSGMGHKVTRVTMQPGGTGATLLRMNSGGRGSSIAVASIGYLGPSLFGLGAAKLIAVGHILAVPWLALLALVILLPVLRGWFAVTSVILTGGLIFLVARYASVGAQVAVAYGIAWFLLLSGIRGIREHGSSAADAGKLKELTYVPTGFWSLLWHAGSLAALVIGGGLLV